MNKRTAPTLDVAVCDCGHWFDDHHCDNINYTTGRITLGACLDTTCPCTTYTRQATAA